MTASVDIDALFPSLTVKWREREWSVSAGVPLSALTMASELGEFDPSNVEHTLVLVSGLFRVDVDEIRQLDPSREELLAILMQVGKHLGMSVGESSASSSAPEESATPSRPTSNASTEST